MSRPPGQDRRLTKVLAALRQHGGPGRSPLYRWMRRHHDALAAAFAETPPAWIPLAAEMAAVGLTDAEGKPPSAASARQTWYRVRRDLARARDQQTQNAPVLAPDEIAPAVHAVATAGDPTPRPRISLDIRPARPAAGASPASPADATGAPQVETSPAPPTAAEETPAEQMRRLLTSMEARKVPLPKLM